MKKELHFPVDTRHPWKNAITDAGPHGSTHGYAKELPHPTMVLNIEAAILVWLLAPSRRTSMIPIRGAFHH